MASADREEGWLEARPCDLPVPCGRTREAPWVQIALGSQAAQPSSSALTVCSAERSAAGTMKLALSLLLVTLALCCSDGECHVHSDTISREGPFSGPGD